MTRPSSLCRHRQERANGSASPWLRPALVIIKAAITWKTKIRRSLMDEAGGDLCLQMTRDAWNQQSGKLSMLKAHQALTKELDRNLKKNTR